MKQLRPYKTKSITDQHRLFYEVWLLKEANTNSV